jgi:formylglycine-generating enzyme required for sulfatase activity
VAIGNCPADNVSWFDAIAYCRWASARLGYEVRLPTETEWQQATTGGQRGNEYPWGFDWREGCANTSESRLGRTTAVGMYPAGASAQGVLDLAGNVWEWCLSEHADPRQTALRADARRVVRGGSWDSGRGSARCACRLGGDPGYRGSDLGLRLVCVSPILKR